MSNELTNVMIEGLDPALIAKLHAKQDDTAGWQTVYGAYQNDKILSGEVSSIERIGTMDCAIVNVENVRGIIPLEYFGVNYKREMRNYVGRPINFKVVKYDRENEIFTGSRIEAQKHLAELTIKRINVGDIIPAVVTRVVPNSLYADIGGIEVNIPIEEIRYGWIDDLFEEYKAGDHLLVKVLDISDVTEETKDSVESVKGETTESVGVNGEADEMAEYKQKYRVKVSGKQAQKSPWDADGIAHTYRKSSEHAGVVSGVQDYGIFVRLADGVDSLAPHMKFENLKKGDRVVVRIRDVDVEKEQIRSRITRVIEKV